MEIKAEKKDDLEEDNEQSSDSELSKSYFPGTSAYYEKGHICPSADRLYSKDVNAWAMNEVNFEAGDYVLKPGRMVPKLFFDVTIEHFKGMHHTYRDMVVAQAGINQSGKITPVSLNSTTVLAAALSARGLPDSIDDMEDLESINVQFNSLGMVFQDMDIYTGDIDWNWEPPASA